MKNSKLRILISLFSSSTEIIAIVDEDLNVLWSNNSDMTEKFRKSDFYDAPSEEHIAFFSHRFDEKIEAVFPIKIEKVLTYETDQHFCTVNVLPVFDDSEGDKVEGYVLTLHNFFSEVEKHINSPFTSVLKKFLRMLRNTASEVVFNTGLIDERLEDLEEYDLMDKNANINKVLYGVLSSCANFEEVFIYGANDFNVMLANASEFITDVMHFAEHSARKIGVKISYEIQDDIYLNVDYSRFLIAIMNLISNGIKYNLSERKKIFVEFKQMDGNAYLIVTDNGIGISNEKAYKIFEPFSNVNMIGTRESLGLPIVKKFADKFGGGIKFKTDASGTSFVLKLPCAKSVDADTVTVPNTDYFKGIYSPIDIYIIKASKDEDLA